MASDPADAADPVAPSVPLAVRVQIIATEHWGLLAARSVLWSEVMSRITIYLTVASASLVVLALVAQTTGYGTAFRLLSIGLASLVLLLGSLTALRVINASLEDYALVVGMNRLRAAYVSIDPSLTQYLTTDWHDDEAGAMRTQTLGMRRHLASHVLAGTSIFVHAVNTVVAGTLGALITAAGGGSVWLVTVVGIVVAVVHLAVVMNLSRKSFMASPLESRFPTPG